MKNCFILILFVVCSCASAQDQHTGWLASFNTFGLNQRLSVHFDAQLRSTDRIKNVQTLLLRPGLNYHFGKSLTGSMGYAFIDNRRTIGPLTGYVSEHRIWEQLLVSHSWKNFLTAHRFRLEQRFLPVAAVINNELHVTDRASVHRFRYFIRNMFPLQKGRPFNKGFFFALQNEVFLNIGDNDPVNGKTFDQNRLYPAVGYRLPGKFDLETGYLYQYTKLANSSVHNHAVQLAVYKRL